MTSEPLGVVDLTGRDLSGYDNKLIAGKAVAVFK